MKIAIHSMGIILSLLVLYSSELFAERIVLLESTDEPVEAFYFSGTGSEAGAVPGAIIYNHGRIVEVEGYERAAAQGYDVADYAKAIQKSGFVALAPIRTTGSDPLAVLRAGIEFLVAKHSLSANQIALCGFSKGGAVTFDAALELKHPGPLVLMSPAIGAGSLKRLKSLSVPVLLTLGQNDPASIQDFVRQQLQPALLRAGASVKLLDSYPGNHRWFWQVKGEHWQDVERFLRKTWNLLPLNS